MGDTRRHLQADRASGHDAVGMQRAVREDRHRLAFEMTEPRERLRRRALVAQAAVDVEGLPLASQHLGIECRLAVEGLRVRSLERRLENFNAPESGAVDGSFYRHPGLRSE